MTEPDNWVVLKIVTETETFYKILAGWSGGYLSGSSWKLNSGIFKVEEDENYFYFHGFSGSIYKCHKESYCLRTNNFHVWDMLKAKFPDSISIMDEDTNWKELIND